LAFWDVASCCANKEDKRRATTASVTKLRLAIVPAIARSKW
jgi:hypothetical protein